jgi:glycerate kinase
VKQADIVLTGEGRVDRTSWEGKTLGELAIFAVDTANRWSSWLGGSALEVNAVACEIVAIGDKKMSPAGENA